MTNAPDKLGKIQTSFTSIKSGVDLKKRFKRVLDRHPNTNMASDAAKSLIALELYEQVVKDSPK
tara:strand:+ start:276 stop:467 length:192 start_codon:yes stop_codon:yes gene_type:complete